MWRVKGQEKRHMRANCILLVVGAADERYECLHTFISPCVNTVYRLGEAPVAFVVARDENVGALFLGKGDLFCQLKGEVREAVR